MRPLLILIAVALLGVACSNPFAPKEKCVYEKPDTTYVHLAPGDSLPVITRVGWCK